MDHSLAHPNLPEILLSPRGSRTGEEEGGICQSPRSDPQLAPGSHLLGTRSLTGLPEHEWLETPPCPRKAAPTFKPSLPHLLPLATNLLLSPLGTGMSPSPPSAAHPSQPRPKPPGHPCSVGIRTRDGVYCLTRKMAQMRLFAGQE